MQRRHQHEFGPPGGPLFVDLQRYRMARREGFTTEEAERLALMERKGGAGDERSEAVNDGTVQLFSGYEPHAKQQQLHRCGARFPVVCAGRRGGKTYGGGREFIKRVMFAFRRFQDSGQVWRRPSKLGPEVKPAVWFWCVAPTYALGYYQRQEIFDIVGGEDSPLVERYDRNKSVLWLKGGIRIDFKSAADPKKLVGSGLDGMWIDEAARLKPGAWGDNLRPTLSDKGGWCLFTTSPVGQNWFWEKIWQRTQYTTDPKLRHDDFHGIHFRTADNTAVPLLVKEARLAKETLPKHLYLRNYEASFSAFEGKIFTQFLNDDTHIVSKVPFRRIEKRIAGVDWGFSNPGAQIEAGFDDDGTVWVYREDYARELTVRPPSKAPKADSWIRRFKRAKKRGVSRWWADPSSPEHISAAQEEDLEMKPADNSVGAGLDVMQAMMHPAPRPSREGRGQPALKIHAGCSNLRRELSGYKWRDGTEEPEKENDHAIDALRYLLYSEHKRGDGLSRLRDLSVFQRVA